MMVLQQAVVLSKNSVVRFAALTHDLGKALTPAEFWPQHRGHEKKGLAALKKLTSRLRVPNEYIDLAQKVMQFHTHCHRALELKPSTLLKLLDSLGAFRQEEKLDNFLLACEADSKGRLGLEKSLYPQADWIKQAFLAANEVNASEFVDQGLVGQEIGVAINNKRLEMIAGLINKNR
jgi:tRNA nucleotidyltransferase (CCA-adding enzyme)